MFVIIHLGNHSLRDRKESRVVGFVKGREELDSILQQIPIKFAKENDLDDDEQTVSLVKIASYSLEKAHNFYHDDIWVMYDVDEGFKYSGLKPGLYWRISLE